MSDRSFESFEGSAEQTSLTLEEAISVVTKAGGKVSFERGIGNRRPGDEDDTTDK